MEDTKKEVVLRVKAGRDPDYVKKVAGAIGWQLRERGCCKARAVKSEAVNTSIKAVAIVNDRVSRAGMTFEIELFFSPADPGKERSSTAIEMVIHEHDGSSQPEDTVNYKVSGKTDDREENAKKLAGAIAVQARKDKVVRLRCIGPTAVYKAVLASCMAKGYIYPNGFSSSIVPKWASFKPEEGNHPVSLLEIDFCSKKLET